MATVSPDTGQLRLVRLISRQVSPIHCRGRRCGYICWVFKMFSTSRQRYFALVSLLLGFFVISPINARAQVIGVIDPLVVTASRVPEDLSSVPYAIQTILSEDLIDGGVATVNEALRVIGGIQSSINTGGGRDQILDLRGFGEESASNQVILVDGVRQNEGDKRGVDLSWISINSVERIEILRGSGAVMYGEGAAAGVINVITKKNPGKTDDRVLIGWGSHSTSEVRISKHLPLGHWSNLISANRYLTDNHRDNHAYQGAGAALNSNWSDSRTAVGISLSIDENSMGLPGGVNVADALARPSFSYKPNDKGNSNFKGLTLSGERELGEGWHAALDIARRLRSTDSDYVADSYTYANQNAMSRVGARTWWNINALGLPSVLVLGLDQERWIEDRQLVGSGWSSNQRIDQRSDAIYIRQSTQLTPDDSVFLGARRTLSDRVSEGSPAGTLKARNNSWEVGGARALSTNEKFFIRVGQGVRLAKADEFATCYPPGPCSDAVNTLRPQTSRDAEIGYARRHDDSAHEIRVYQNRIKDEIGLDSRLSYSVVNYSPTVREGIEYNFSGTLSRSWTFGGALSVRSSKFKGGALDGNQVPLVSRYFGTANLKYLIDANSSVTITSQVQSSQFVSGDIANSCSDKLPGYGIANLKYTRAFAKYTVRADLNNVFDRNYYNFRSRCDAAARSVYPEAGRTLFVSLERTF